MNSTISSVYVYCHDWGRNFDQFCYHCCYIINTIIYVCKRKTIINIIVIIEVLIEDQLNKTVLKLKFSS